MLLSHSCLPFTAVTYDVVMDKKSGDLDARSWFGVKKVMKGENPFVNLPYVKVMKQQSEGLQNEGEGALVSQTNACLTYVGREIGYYPSDRTLQVTVETILCETMDLRNNMTEFAYKQDGNLEGEGRELLRGVRGKNGILGKFELFCRGREIKNEYLVGGEPSPADFHLYEMIEQYCMLSEFLGEGDFLDGFLDLKLWYAAFKGDPKNQYYLSSDLNRLPYNNKKARFGSVPGGGRFEKGQEYDWGEYGGVYQNTYKEGQQSEGEV